MTRALTPAQKAAHAARMRAYYMRNGEQMRARNAIYCRAHRAEINARARARRAEKRTTR